MLNLADSFRKLAQFQLRLSKFDFNVMHRAGIGHQSADGLSHLPTNKHYPIDLNDALPVLMALHTKKAKTGLVKAKIAK